ncbi:hypothetical protein Despr_0220 [Desulfobulbus propionicus DSM 2032]|uniref:Uncharacterized protein n=1 Tax=Desulfobulbus propionicus (strain ATCC 33891 / DSM 2032 / VKM B-1956 / 1pr3) TaxID=577650 RepID=A0A7U3YJ96_DESPD|nr:hypothetical protein Despr_0220 [Desulfobulbus propionicus DSM 2032]
MTGRKEPLTPRQVVKQGEACDLDRSRVLPQEPHLRVFRAPACGCI